MRRLILPRDHQPPRTPLTMFPSAPLLSGLLSECRRQGSWPPSAWSLREKAGRALHMLVLALPVMQHIHSTQYSLQCCKPPAIIIHKQTTRHNTTIQYKLRRRYILTSGSQTHRVAGHWIWCCRGPGQQMHVDIMCTLNCSFLRCSLSSSSSARRRASFWAASSA